MAGFSVSRIGDTSDHGATIITGAVKHTTNGISTARVGDLVSCPIPYHGINQIIAVHPNVSVEGQETAHVAAVCACGAVILTGSPNVNRS